MSQFSEAGAIANTFTGTDRFQLIDQLGAGSMCVVYKVKDRKHGDIVALKTLRHLDSNSLYRLKQEFRALSHFDHPNLVSFSELVHSPKGWFVTMELVEGTDFLTFNRGYERHRESRSSQNGSTWSELEVQEHGGADPQSKPSGGYGLPDLVRLRSTMRQLAEGVQTLHGAGRVHRDLKPSNVMVTDAGRVVILDFGLVAEIDQDYTEGTLAQNIAGSAAYMSPEQSVGRPLSEASDWYSVGVMLYEALTGVWPYSGHLYQILTMKQEEDPPAPNTLVDGIPDDLNDLAMGLLARDPSQRPRGTDVIAVFRPKTSVDSSIRLQPRFRYRDEQLHLLLKAFQAVKWGKAITLLLRGPLGLGKTTLFREFVKGIKRRDEVIILKSRCFKWETLPYKALDGLTDNLSRVLRRLDHRKVATLNNRGLPYLAMMFPVLNRVDAFGLTEPADYHRLDEGTIRQRGFEGLFNLLQDLSAIQPIVLFLDDVQWGDEESASVLGEILRFAPKMPMLVILAYQAEERSPFIHQFLPPVQEAGIPVQSLDLKPLTFEQACVVTAEMLNTDIGSEMVRGIAIESGGVPKFIKELVRQKAFQDSRASSGEDDELNEVTVTAIQSLHPNAARLLMVLALCDAPLPDEVALVAAELSGDAFEAISTLRAHRLVNVAGIQSGDTLQIQSERVRDYVFDHIPEEWRVGFHGRIAVTMEDRGGFDPATLVSHYAGAHMFEKAGLVAWLSADEVIKKNKPHEAAWLLSKAREYGSWTPRELRMIVTRHAEALASIGSGKAASEAFLEAAKDAAPPRARELTHRAAEELIGSGHVEEGKLILDQLLQQVGVTTSSGGWFGGSLNRMRRMRLRWRGLDFSTTPATAVTEDKLFQVDLCWTNAMGVGLVDAARGAIAQTSHLEIALEVGEPERALRALAAEVRFLAYAGDPSWRERFQHVMSQAQKRGSKQAIARSTYAAAEACLNTGAWIEAAKYADSAEHMLTHNRVGSAWERFLCRTVAARAQRMRGDLRSAAARALPLVRELENADNALFLTILHSSIIAWLRLAEDDPEAGLALLAGLPPHLASTVSIPFFHVLVSWTQLELYRGRAPAAWDYIDERWRAAERGLESAPPLLRAEVWLARARAAVGSAALGAEVPSMVRAATTSIAGARTLELDWVEPWCLLLEVGLARIEGRSAEGVGREIIGHFEATDQSLGAAVALACSGDQGMGRASEWMRAQGIRSAERLVRMLAPGCGV